MGRSYLRVTLNFLILGFTLAAALAQSSNVAVFQSQAAFETATGAKPLPFPSSANVLPLKTVFPGLSDYSCVYSPPGIDLPVNSTVPLAKIEAPKVPPDLICFIGKGWNAGTSNIDPQPEGPTIVANGEDDFRVTFVAPVYAVGFELLTNFSAEETITLKFTDGTEESFGSLATAPNSRQFVGFASTKPIGSVNVDTFGGAAQNEGIAAVLSAFAVAVDIKPCSDPSPVNLKSNGVVSAVVLGSASLDVSLIDPRTVTLQGFSPKEPGNSGKLLCKIEDVAGRDKSCGPDGFPDLLCHFQIGASDRDLTEEIWTLRAQTYSGVALLGYDSVKVIIPPSTDKSGNNGNGIGNGKPDNPGNGASVPPGQDKAKPGKGKSKGKGP